MSLTIIENLKNIKYTLKDEKLFLQLKSYEQILQEYFSCIISKEKDVILIIISNKWFKKKEKQKIEL